MFGKLGLSLKKSLALLLLALGSVGIFLVYITINQFRTLAYENHETSINQLLDVQIENLISEAIEISTELALSVQNETKFQKAVETQDIDTLNHYIQEQQHRYFVTMGFIKINSIFIFDKYMNQITTSSNFFARDLCLQFIIKAAIRKGADRTKIIEGRCFNNGQLSLSIIIPIGSIFNQVGYMQIIIDPEFNLHKLENIFNQPIRLSDSNNNILYQSDNWTSLENKKTFVRAYRYLRTKEQPKALKIELLSRMHVFEEKLNSVRLSMIIISISIITLAMLISFIFIRQSILGPFMELTQKINHIKGGGFKSDEDKIGFSSFLNALAQFYEHLNKQATIDPLTGLPNRLIFNDRLKELIYRCKRNNEMFSLMILDLNSFKQVNDTYGHLTGDYLLKNVALRIQLCLREEDTVCRMGGDEFTILLPEVTDNNSPLIVAKKIIESLNSPFNIKDQIIKSGVSIGIVIYPRHSKHPDKLIELADQAMYRAKKNKTHFHLAKVNNKN